MNGIGLVLAGGGGKGAYQIGIWKYLNENGLSPYIDAVSGTSVGALNAALFAAGDFTTAEEIWLGITPEQILSPRNISLEEITLWLSSLGSFSLLGMSAAAPSLLAPTIATMLRRRASFSRDGLINIIQQHVNIAAIQNSKIPCFATCLDISSLSPHRFELRNFSQTEIQNILLASSAIPLIFDNVILNDRTYCDGGVPIVGDNVPVTPIYELGFPYILAVHLDRDFLIDKAQFPNTQILEILPSQDLGGPLDGTLDFTGHGARWRIELGYQDAKRTLEPFIQQILLQFHLNQLFTDAKKRQTEFTALHETNMQRLRELQAQKLYDDFDAIADILKRGEPS